LYCDRPARDCIDPRDRICATAFATDGFSATFSTRIAPPPPGCIARGGGSSGAAGDWDGEQPERAGGFEISSSARRVLFFPFFLEKEKQSGFY